MRFAPVRNGGITALMLATALQLSPRVAKAQQESLPNQQGLASRFPLRPATTPPGGDTIGYWQQRADYQMVATLDEKLGVLTATGTLRYVNRSPDVLRDLWVHQHLNAFRPG